MELTLFLSLFLASAVSGAAIEMRQAPKAGTGGLASIFEQFMPKEVKLYRTVDVKTRVRATAKRQQLMYGPLVLPASKVI
jgi:hypothetical protein